MADFQGVAFGSAFYNVGGARDTLEGGTWRFSVGSTILARVQEILRVWAASIMPTAGARIDVYRAGGPLDAKGTTINLELLSVDREHGPVTNGALWAYVAKKALPSIPWTDILDGRIPDDGTRNALDKIEETLRSGQLTLTTARVMLWVIENRRDPDLTWARFVANQTPDFNRALWRPYALRRPLPLAASPAGLMVLESDQPQTQTATFVISLTHCLRIGSSITAEELRRRVAAVPSTMGTWAGATPRITRQYAGLLESCMERVRLRWPITVALPDPNLFRGSAERFAMSMRDAIAASLGSDADEWEVNVLPFDPAINGSLREWSSGVLANTATRDSAIAGVEENPDGPSGLRPTAQGTADRVVEAIGAIGGIAVAVSAFWFGGKLLGVVGTRSTVTSRRQVEVLTAPRANKASRRGR